MKREKRDKPRSAPGLYSVAPCFNCGGDTWRLANVQPPPEPCEYDCIYCGDLLLGRLTPAQYEAIRYQEAA